MNDKEAMELALDALEAGWSPTHTGLDAREMGKKAITALKERLAQPEQEPVVCRFCRDERGCWAWQCDNCGEIDDSLEVPPPAAPVQDAANAQKIFTLAHHRRSKT
jgi:hypothetical protein